MQRNVTLGARGQVGGQAMVEIAQGLADGAEVLASQAGAVRPHIAATAGRTRASAASR